MKINTNRRDFLRSLAKAGVLLPFANQLLGAHNAFAASADQRVIFFYYPNGMHLPAWTPSGDNTSSFALEPLRSYSSKLLAFNNLELAGVPDGGHEEALLNCLVGKSGPGSGDATIDHVVAEKLNCKPVYLGVRTGNDASKMVSKPRGVESSQRPIPNNDPKDAADKLFGSLGSGSGSGTNTSANDLRKRMLGTILDDFKTLNNLALKDVASTSPLKSKVDLHQAAIADLQSKIGSTINVGNGSFTKTTVTDPYKNGGTNPSDKYEKHNMVPSIARAQIDNIVAAVAYTTKVATLQFSHADENGDYVNYCFDECWSRIQAASGKYGNISQRWYNEHTSHTASHVQAASHAGQVQWYADLLRYMLDQLKAFNMLDNTLVVMMSEVGDGNAHGPHHGGVLLAGGAGGNMNMGRVVNANGRSTADLFNDIANRVAMGSSSAVNGW